MKTSVAVKDWWDDTTDVEPAAATLPPGPSEARITTPYGVITVRIQIVTPEYAQHLLDSMGRNRHPKAKQVRDLVHAMCTGSFVFNGEPIIIDEHGQMMDGQHRCLSSVRSGKSFPALIVSGILRSAFDTIDQGSRRTAGDVLSMRDIPNGSLKAAAVRLLLAHERRGGLWNASSDTVSIREIETNLARWPHLDDGCRLATRINRISCLSTALLAALHSIFATKDATLAQLFFTSIADGADLPGNDPILLLRNRLVDNRVRLKSSREKVTYREWCARFIHAWNAVRAGRHLTQLRGVIDDKMPEIK